MVAVEPEAELGEWFDAAGVHARLGVPPASIPDLLALVGDAADGFPGLPGWGAKSAAAVLDRLAEARAAVPRERHGERHGDTPQEEPRLPRSQLAGAKHLLVVRQGHGIRAREPFFARGIKRASSGISFVVQSVARCSLARSHLPKRRRSGPVRLTVTGAAAAGNRAAAGADRADRGPAGQDGGLHPGDHRDGHRVSTTVGVSVVDTPTESARVAGRPGAGGAVHCRAAAGAGKGVAEAVRDEVRAEDERRDRDRGHRDDVRRRAVDGAAVVRHLTPRRVGRADPEADEREERLAEHHRGQLQEDGDDQHPERVRDEVADEHAVPASPDRFRGPPERAPPLAHRRRRRPVGDHSHRILREYSGL